MLQLLLTSSLFHYVTSLRISHLVHWDRLHCSIKLKCSKWPGGLRERRADVYHCEHLLSHYSQWRKCSFNGQRSCIVPVLPSSCWRRSLSAASGSPVYPLARRPHRVLKWASPAAQHPSEPEKEWPERSWWGGRAWGYSYCNPLHSARDKKKKKMQ